MKEKEASDKLSWDELGTYQLATFREPFTEQRVCINFN